MSTSTSTSTLGMQWNGKSRRDLLDFSLTSRFHLNGGLVHIDNESKMIIIIIEYFPFCSYGSTGLQYSHKWLFSLLFAIQTDTLFARTAEAFIARPRSATIPIEKTITADQQSIGTASHQSGTIFAAGGTRCDFLQIGIVASIFAERTTGVIVHTIARGHRGRVSDEWLPNIGELLYHRMHEQTAGEGNPEHWSGRRIHRSFCTVFDANGERWQRYIGSQTDGFRSAVHYTATTRWLSNRHSEKVSQSDAVICKSM